MVTFAPNVTQRCAKLLPMKPRPPVINTRDARSWSESFTGASIVQSQDCPYAGANGINLLLLQIEGAWKVDAPSRDVVSAWVAYSIYGFAPLECGQRRKRIEERSSR